MNLDLILLVDSVVKLGLLYEHSHRVLGTDSGSDFSLSSNNFLVDSSDFISRLSVISRIESGTELKISLLKHGLYFRVELEDSVLSLSIAFRRDFKILETEGLLFNRALLEILSSLLNQLSVSSPVFLLIGSYSQLHELFLSVLEGNKGVSSHLSSQFKERFHSQITSCIALKW